MIKEFTVRLSDVSMGKVLSNGAFRLSGGEVNE